MDQNNAIHCELRITCNETLPNLLDADEFLLATLPITTFAGVDSVPGTIQTVCLLFGRWWLGGSDSSLDSPLAGATGGGAGLLCGGMTVRGRLGAVADTVGAAPPSLDALERDNN